MSRCETSRVVTQTYKVFLGGMTAITAGLLSLAVVVSVGPFIENGEVWEGLGLLWWFSIPVIGVLGILSPFVIRWYRRPTDSLRWGLAFLAVAGSVAGAGMLVTWLSLGITY